jgi:hypothetical protein
MEVQKNNLATFVVLVWGRWETRFGTTFAVMLALAQYVVLEWRGSSNVWEWVKSFPPSIWLAVGGLLLFWSCYGVWHEERSKTDEFEKRFSAPDLEVSIDGASDGIVGDRLIITVMAQIRNPRGPQCSLYDWDAYIEFPDGKTLRSTDQPRPDPAGVTVDFGKTGKSATLMAERFFPSMTQVIPAGDFISGWMWAAFKGISVESLYEGNARVVLSFKDAVSAQFHIHKYPLKPGLALPSFVNADWIPESSRIPKAAR